jgi:hypothetical protein
LIGLDEKAVEAVRQYKFNPAMEGGEPVLVELNTEVAAFFRTDRCGSTSKRALP